MPRNASSTPDDLGMNQVATRTPSPSASPNATPTATRGPAASHTPSRTAAALKVRVSGNHLVNGAGSTVRLLGANRSGTQYACLEGSGIFDGPSDSASIATMKAWGMTAVRVSLNEDCWLGINGVPAAYSGANYQAAIGGFVDRLNAAGLYVILDLHSNAPGTAKALDQKPMADRDHSPAFWAGVAGHFQGRARVCLESQHRAVSRQQPQHDCRLDLYPRRRNLPRRAIHCGRQPRDGQRYSWRGSDKRRPGRRPAVRRSGGPLDRVQASRPGRAAGSLDPHLLQQPRRRSGRRVICSPAGTGPSRRSAQPRRSSSARSGSTTATRHLMPLLRWADTKGVSYLAWSWFTGNCAGEPALISSYDGTPSGEGAGVRDHLLGLPK